MKHLLSPLDAADHMPSARRGGRTAKLPKMNNSERGKYYRHKHRMREESLVAAVDDLNHLINALNHELNNHPHAHKSSIHCFPSTSQFSMAIHLLLSVSRRALTKRELLRCHDNLADIGDVNAATVLQEIVLEWQEPMTEAAQTTFEVVSFDVVGTVDTPIIAARGLHRLIVTHEMLDTAFADRWLHGNRRGRKIVGRQLAFETHTRLFFSVTGELEWHDIDTKALREANDGGVTLAQALGLRLRDMSHHWRKKEVQNESRPRTAMNSQDVVDAAKVLMLGSSGVGSCWSAVHGPNGVGRTLWSAASRRPMSYAFLASESRPPRSDRPRHCHS